MLKHRLTLPVRWSESDPAGIAFYPRFFEWFDVATASLFARIDEPWERCFRAHDILGVAAIVGVQAVDYHLLYPGAGENVPGEEQHQLTTVK